MGWTVFSCFGCTNKRKRPKKASEFGCKSRRIQGYQPLQSDVPDEGAVSELSSSNLELREKPKDEKKAKVKKRVRFNLDLITYEPIIAYDATSLDEDEDDKHWEETVEEDQQAAAVCLVSLSKGDSVESTLASLSASHRYSNCYDDRDEYDGDEDEDIECEVSDLDDDDNDDDIDDALADEHQDLSCVPLISSARRGLRISNDSTTNTPLKRPYIIPVLKPIENVSQWKEIKARKCRF